MYVYIYIVIMCVYIYIYVHMIIMVGIITHLKHWFPPVEKSQAATTQAMVVHPPAAPSRRWAPWCRRRGRRSRGEPATRRDGLGTYMETMGVTMILYDLMCDFIWFYMILTL